MADRNACCVFCGNEARLCESHIIPAFLFRWLRQRSGKGYIRSTEEPNRRVQDGPKIFWLCRNCEQAFNQFETAFANKLFLPWTKGDALNTYGDWLLKFCVSLSWRVLKFLRGRNPRTQYTSQQQALMDQAELRWRSFLMGNAPHPAKFEQHLIPWGITESTTIQDLPKNFNRFMDGAITFDIVGSGTSLMTFSKLRPFIIFGFIQQNTAQWQGTKVHVRHGHLRRDKIVLPYPVIDFFK